MLLQSDWLPPFYCCTNTNRQTNKQTDGREYKKEDGKMIDIRTLWPVTGATNSQLPQSAVWLNTLLSIIYIETQFCPCLWKIHTENVMRGNKQAMHFCCDRRGKSRHNNELKVFFFSFTPFFLLLINAEYENKV